MPRSLILVALTGALSATLGCGGASASSPSDANLHAVLWTQSAIEFELLTQQAFRHAARELDAALADPSWTAAVEQVDSEFGHLPPAVILDLDETVLDNSPYQAWLVQSGEQYGSASWTSWCSAADAGLISGALEFVDYAQSQGVTVFFVSNRNVDVEEATRANLERLGFSLDQDIDTVLLKAEEPEWGSDKGNRRERVAETHRIVMLVGDNFGDFLDHVDVSPAERSAMVVPFEAWIGSRWIVLPNPQYGSWEGSVIGFDWGQTPEARFETKVRALEAWSPY